MSESRTAQEGEIQLTLASEKRALASALQLTTELVRDLLASEDILRFQLALQELLMNAFEHGNLGITSDEKVALCEAGKLEAAHEERSLQARAASKTIRLSASLTAGVFRCSIEDDGSGFDWKQALARSQNGVDLLAPAGRGLSIINAMFDEVQFNDAGNRVTVMKILRR